MLDNKLLLKKVEFFMIQSYIAQSFETIEYIDCISASTLPTNVLDMTLNNLMVRLQ